MAPFESMKAPLHQPLIPVVLRALAERHPAFGSVCYKNSPTGEQPELLDRFFIPMHRQRKVSELRHLKGAVGTGAASADILFLRGYGFVDLKRRYASTL